MDLLLTFAVVDIWGFLLMTPYWLLRTFGKTPNISHATTTGLESAGEKQLNPTVPVPELTSYPVLNHLIHGLSGKPCKGGFIDMKLNFLDLDLRVEVLL